MRLQRTVRIGRRSPEYDQDTIAREVQREADRKAREQRLEELRRSRSWSTRLLLNGLTFWILMVVVVGGLFAWQFWVAPAVGISTHIAGFVLIFALQLTGLIVALVGRRKAPRRTPFIGPRALNRKESLP